MIVHYLATKYFRHKLNPYREDNHLTQVFQNTYLTVDSIIDQEYLWFLGYYSAFTILFSQNPILFTLLFHWVVLFDIQRKQQPVLKARWKWFNTIQTLTLQDKDFFYLIPLFCILFGFWFQVFLHLVYYILLQHEDKIQKLLKDYNVDWKQFFTLLKDAVKIKIRQSEKYLKKEI